MKMHKVMETNNRVLFEKSHLSEGEAPSRLMLTDEEWEAMGSPERLDVTVRPQRETPIAVARVVKA